MTRRPLLVASALLLALPRVVVAQGGTDIWVARFSDIAGRVSVGRPANVTRRAGYDNQPAFTPDGSTILFTSTRGDGQADIWRVPVTGGAHVRVTTSDPESEYSATPLPGGNGFSAIRVERDSVQRLWRFDYDGTGAALVLRALRPVGYHVWIGDATLGTFVLGAPNALVLVDPRTEQADTLARDIGRALVRVPGRDAFTFLQVGKDTSWISEVDVRTRTVRRIAPSPVGSDYHLWTPSGQLIASVGTGLMIRVGERWDVLADFAELGVKDVSRLALSPRGDRIAFVAADGR
jgi:WD40 repeat protein